MRLAATSCELLRFELRGRGLTDCDIARALEVKAGAVRELLKG